MLKTNDESTEFSKLSQNIFFERLIGHEETWKYTNGSGWY